MTMTGVVATAGAAVGVAPGVAGAALPAVLTVPGGGCAGAVVVLVTDAVCSTSASGGSEATWVAATAAVPRPPRLAAR